MQKPSPASGKKPKALFLSPEAPYPAIGGGPLRSASLLEYLARSYSVHAVVFREPGASDPADAVPAGRIDELSVLELTHHSKHPFHRTVRNSLRLLRNSPPLVDRFSGYAEPIAKLLSGRSYDVAIVEHFWCAPYVEQLRPHAKRVILDLHNVESRWHQNLAIHEAGARAFALRRFGAASLELERRWLPKFDTLLVTSSEEAALVREIVDGIDILLYPNALPEIPRPPRRELEEIVFTGNLEYPPNIGAILFFRDQVWPRLRARPGLIWKIVGKNPEAIRNQVAGDARIRLTGFVEDAVAELAASKVAVVPVLSGSGTRIKILEAWAAGTAVVSTRLGAEGLVYRDGEHLMVADGSEEFANAVAKLLDNPVERTRVGDAGRKLFEQYYTWPIAWQSLATLLGNGHQAC